jgi:xylulokinase
MEGVAFALRQTLEISLSMTDPAESIIVAGGGAESNVWRGIQADVFGLPLRRTLQPEQTCVGAALLAGAGTGCYQSLEEAVAGAARHGPPTEPDLSRHDRYNTFYAMFCDLYPHLQTDFHRLTAFSLKE